MIMGVYKALKSIALAGRIEAPLVFPADRWARRLCTSGYYSASTNIRLVPFFDSRNPK